MVRSLKKQIFLTLFSPGSERGGGVYGDICDIAYFSSVPDLATEAHLIVQACYIIPEIHIVSMSPVVHESWRSRYGSGDTHPSPGTSANGVRRPQLLGTTLTTTINWTGNGHTHRASLSGWDR